MQGTDSFRELPQVGQGLEAAFHDSGYRTWADLAAASPDDLRDAASVVRPTSLKQVAGWQRVAASRARPDPTALRADGVEHYHSFVVKVLVDEQGLALRSSAQDARTQLERSWKGWQPAELVAYLEAESGLATRSAGPPKVLASIDAGTTLGGRRDVSVQVPASTLCSKGAVRYSARLMARPLGEHDGVLVSACRGEALADRDLALEFGEVEMPTGVQRLSVGMEIDPVAQG